MQTKSEGQNVRSEGILPSPRCGKAGPKLWVVGLWIIAREWVQKASDYVQKQGKVRENEWQGFQVRSGCGTGENQVYSTR